MAAGTDSKDTVRVLREQLREAWNEIAELETKLRKIEAAADRLEEAALEQATIRCRTQRIASAMYDRLKPPKTHRGFMWIPMLFVEDGEELYVDGAYRGYVSPPEGAADGDSRWQWVAEDVHGQWRRGVEVDHETAQRMAQATAWDWLQDKGGAR